MSDQTHEIIKSADVVPVRGIMHPVVERMLAASPTPETLREILALQREWERDEAKRAYTRAIVELRRDLPPFIKRDKKVAYLNVKYSHTSLAAAMEAVQPALTNHGFNLSWTPACADGKVSVTASLTHRDGHRETATLTAPADASGSKNAAQAVASTVTLLQRYTALSLLGIATADMKDQDGSDSGEPDATSGAGAVDSAKNMRAMGELAKAGKTKEQAESHVASLVQDWTADDLAKLKAWIAPPKQAAPAPEPERDVVDDLADKEPITEVQRKQLFDALKATGKTNDQLMRCLVDRYAISTTAAIPQMLFSEILKWCKVK